MEQQPDTSALASDVIARAASGDQGAWNLLVRTYGPRVFAVAQSRLHDPDAAEELTQSVFATLAVKLTKGDYKEMGRFESWLFRVAMNRVRDAVRRAVRRPEVSNQDGLSIADDRDRSPTPPNDLLALRAAMERLPPLDREIVELRHHCGLSFQQISDVLQEPIGTLLARHHRALRKLREMLEHDRALGLESGLGESS